MVWKPSKCPHVRWVLDTFDWEKTREPGHAAVVITSFSWPGYCWGSFRKNKKKLLGKKCCQCHCACLFASGQYFIDQSPHYMPITFQAKEQGKAEVEELLSKLEKVTNQASQINLHAWSCSFLTEFTVLCFFRPILSSRWKFRSSRTNCARWINCWLSNYHDNKKAFIQRLIRLLFVLLSKICICRISFSLKSRSIEHMYIQNLAFFTICAACCSSQFIP